MWCTEWEESATGIAGRKKSQEESWPFVNSEGSHQPVEGAGDIFDTPKHHEVLAVVDLMVYTVEVLCVLCSGTATWKQQLTEVNDEVIVEASQWLLDTIPTFTQDTVSSLIGSLTDEQVDIIWQ